MKRPVLVKKWSLIKKKKKKKKVKDVKANATYGKKSAKLETPLRKTKD